jgi:predicted PurR-regulated permease PerM
MQKSENGWFQLWDWTPRKVMLATILVVALAASFWLFYRFRAVLLFFFIAVILATAIRPIVEWMAERGVRRAYAEVFVYLVLLAALAGFLLFVMPLILEQSARVANQLEGYYRSARYFLVNSPSDILHRLGYEAPPQFQVENLVPDTQSGSDAGQAQSQSGTASVSRAFRYVGLFGRGLFAVIAVLLLAFYWTLESDRAIRSILLFVPSSQREKTREIITAVENKLGDFIIGQSILCATIGVLSLIAFVILGLPNALVLAILAGILEAVPIVGPVLGAVPPVLVALSTAPDKVIWVVVAAVVIQQLENNLLVPRVMDRSVGVNPLLTLLSLAAFSSLLGVAGALMAIPVAAVVQLLFNRFVFHPIKQEAPKPEGRDYVSYLRLQVQEVAQDIRKSSGYHDLEDDDSRREQEDLEESVEALANDLDRLLARISVSEEASS